MTALDMDAFVSKLTDALTKQRELPDGLSPAQAAEFLGLGKQQVYLGLQKGELPGRKVGNRWILSRTALVDWLRCKSRGTERTGT